MTEEKIRNFQKDFETKLQLEKTQFERQKLELEMKMKELEMPHQLREKHGKLERKLKITTLQKDDVLSQSAKACDMLPFNWITTNTDDSEWAKRMSRTQTPTRPKSCFDVSLERSEDRHYSRYLNTLDRSSSIEDRDVLQKVGMRTKTGLSSSSSLPKLKLHSFDWNVLECLE